MEMRPYVVREGDYLTNLAHRFGFDAHRIWRHATNRELREKRPNPDLLQAGDVLHVPVASSPRGLTLRPRRSNAYRATVPRIEVKLTLRDVNHAPLADKAYRVEGAGRPLEGTTDGAGAMSFEVPVTVREVRLVLVDDGQVYRLLMGNMDPVEERSGVRKRLEHLGFIPRSAASEGHDEGALRAGILAFQAAHQLALSGEIDAATRDELVRAHGS